MSGASVELIDSLRETLRRAADPVRAAQQQAYMKSTMPHRGVMAPELHRIHRALIAEHPLSTCSSWQETVMQLWREAAFREERYAALALLGHKRYRPWLTPALLPALEEIVVTGAWWDFVDPLACHEFGYLLANHPKRLTGVLRRWSRCSDIWKRRTAILAQLKFKADTDETLLFELIEPSIGESEFFLRKAIGWALREYSKTQPESVIDYVTRESDRLSGLSKREALKVLLKKGVVSVVP